MAIERFVGFEPEAVVDRSSREVVRLGVVEAKGGLFWDGVMG
jgi:hypothetical protein